MATKRLASSRPVFTQSGYPKVVWLRMVFFQAAGSNLDAGAVRFQEDGFTDEHGPQPDPGVTLEDKDPGLVLCMELPIRFWREVDPLKDEMRASDEQGSDISKAPRKGWAFSRSRIRGRHGVVYVNFPLSTMAEKAERRAAALLEIALVNFASAIYEIVLYLFSTMH